MQTPNNPSPQLAEMLGIVADWNATRDPYAHDIITERADRLERMVSQQVPPELWMVRGVTWR